MNKTFLCLDYLLCVLGFVQEKMKKKRGSTKKSVTLAPKCMGPGYRGGKGAHASAPPAHSVRCAANASRSRRRRLAMLHASKQKVFFLLFFLSLAANASQMLFTLLQRAACTVEKEREGERGGEKERTFYVVRLKRCKALHLFLSFFFLSFFLFCFEISSHFAVLFFSYTKKMRKKLALIMSYQLLSSAWAVLLFVCFFCLFVFLRRVPYASVKLIDDIACFSFVQKKKKEKKKMNCKRQKKK